MLARVVKIHSGELVGGKGSVAFRDEFGQCVGAEFDPGLPSRFTDRGPDSQVADERIEFGFSDFDSSVQVGIVSAGFGENMPAHGVRGHVEQQAMNAMGNDDGPCPAAAVASVDGGVMVGAAVGVANHPVLTVAAEQQADKGKVDSGSFASARSRRRKVERGTVGQRDVGINFQQVAVADLTKVGAVTKPPSDLTWHIGPASLRGHDTVQPLRELGNILAFRGHVKHFRDDGTSDRIRHQRATGRLTANEGGSLNGADVIRFRGRGLHAPVPERDGTDRGTPPDRPGFRVFPFRFRLVKEQFGVTEELTEHERPGGGVRVHVLGGGSEHLPAIHDLTHDREAVRARTAEPGHIHHHDPVRATRPKLVEGTLESGPVHVAPGEVLILFPDRDFTTELGCVRRDRLALNGRANVAFPLPSAYGGDPDVTDKPHPTGAYPDKHSAVQAGLFSTRSRFGFVAPSSHVSATTTGGDAALIEREAA